MKYNTYNIGTQIVALVLAVAVVDAGVAVDRQAGNFAYGINTLPYVHHVLPYATFNPVVTEIKAADSKQTMKMEQIKLQVAQPYIAPVYTPFPVVATAVDGKDAVDAKKVETIATPYGYPANYFYGGYPFGPLIYPGTFGFFPLNAKSVTEVKPMETVAKAAETTEVKPADETKATETGVVYVA